jgi:tetratricopeptide (TPR) repeat protein
MMTLLVEDGLSRLVTSGFLQMDGRQTVVLHQLLALFTQEVCGAEEMGGAQTAVATQMVQTLWSLRQREGHLATLPFSVAHLRYVSETAIIRKTELAAFLATLLGFHLEDVGYAVEAERVLKRGCAVAEEIGDVGSQAHTLNALANTQESMGHFEDSLRLSEAYRFLAEAYLGQGRIGQALAMAQQALALAYELDPFEDGRAWRVLGLIAARLGQPVPASAHG